MAETITKLPFSQLTELNAKREGAKSRKPIGKLPWKIVPNNLHAAILDTDGNTLFIASIGIAEQILAAVNSHLDLVSKNTELEFGMRSLHGALHELPDRTPHVKKLIGMAQRAIGINCGGDGDH